MSRTPCVLAPSVSQGLDQSHSAIRLLSSKKAPRQRGVCVKHLNRCKTSTAGSFLLVGRFMIHSNSCRGTQHFTGTVSNEATSEMGYPAWPAGRTCIVVITCCSGSASDFFFLFSLLSWLPAKPRTGMSFSHNFQTKLQPEDTLQCHFAVRFSQSVYREHVAISGVVSLTHSCQVY